MNGYININTEVWQKKINWIWYIWKGADRTAGMDCNELYEDAKLTHESRKKLRCFGLIVCFFFSCSQRSCFTFLRTTFFVFSFFSASYNLCLCVCIDDVNWLIWLFNSHRWQPYTAYKSAEDEQRRCATTSRDTHANSAATIFEQTNRKEPRTNEFQDYIVRE